jgi:hypothetical protein
MQQERKALEPISGTVMTVALVHVLVGLVAWRLLSPAAPPVVAPVRQDLRWFSPAEFSFKDSPAPPRPAASKPMAPPAAALLVAKPKPKPSPPAVIAPTALSPAASQARRDRGAHKEANKFITLSPILPEVVGPPAPAPAFKPVLSLLDIAALNENPKKESVETRSSEMDAVDDAVVDAYLSAWIAPPSAEVPKHQRRACLHVSIARDGTVATARLATASGSGVLDMSVLDAATQVQKIPLSLPASFGKRSYELQINFQIE